MKQAWLSVLFGAALLSWLSPASAYAADYTVVHQEIVVARAAETVWKKVGDFCAIGDWMKLKCVYESGSGGVGTVRKLNDAIVELMVAQTSNSYAYAQTAGNMAALTYHGALAVEPLSRNSSKLLYTLVYDAAPLPSDAERKTLADRLNARFREALETMKTMAEAK